MQYGHGYDERPGIINSGTLDVFGERDFRGGPLLGAE
jgi:hypothetical protein